MNSQRFAKGMTFDDYVKFTGSPDNLAREGFDIRIFSLVRPRVDWSAYLRERFARARLSAEQTAAIQWLAAQPGGPAKIAVISEEWSSDCRRDVPYLARLAQAGGLELRIFPRDGDAMLMKGLPEPTVGNGDLVCEYANDKNGQRWASVPVAVFFTEDFAEIYRYIEYPAIYRKERVIGHLRAARADETADQTKSRSGREITALLESPFPDVWAQAGIAEILSALHERIVTGARGRAAGRPPRSGDGAPGVPEPDGPGDRDHERDVGGPAVHPRLARDDDTLLLPLHLVPPSEIRARVALEGLGHPGERQGPVAGAEAPLDRALLQIEAEAGLHAPGRLDVARVRGTEGGQHVAPAVERRQHLGDGGPVGPLVAGIVGAEHQVHARARG